MKKNGISSFAIVKSIKRGPSFHQQPQRWDNTSPITLFYFHVYLKYNKTKSVCFECEEKRQHLSATDDFPPPLASSPPFFIKTLLLYFCTSKAAATQQSWWACKIASIPPYPPSHLNSQKATDNVWLVWCGGHCCCCAG